MLNQDLEGFVALLNENGVRYLVTGGSVTGPGGHTSYPKDILIWIELGADNAARTIKAVEQFGFDFLEMTPADLLEPDKTIELRYPLNRIDLLTGVPGVDFGEAYMARTEIEIGAVRMSFLDLKGFKRSRGK